MRDLIILFEKNKPLFFYNSCLSVEKQSQIIVLLLDAKAKPLVTSVETVRFRSPSACRSIAFIYISHVAEDGKIFLDKTSKIITKNCKSHRK